MNANVRRLLPRWIAYLACCAILGLGCEKEKSGAEKLAEELAAANSAQRAAAQASASAPDPAEERYKQRKTLLEKTLKEMKADEGRLMAHDPAATPGVLRRYFESGDDGDKLAKELEAKRTKDGADGYRLVRSTVSDIRVLGNMEEAEVEVIDETGAKNTTGCFLSIQTWRFQSDRWLYHAQKSVKKVDCT